MLLTLVSQPLSQLHILRASTEGQEVAPHVERGILLLKEVFGSLGVVGLVLNRQTAGDRG